MTDQYHLTPVHPGEVLKDELEELDISLQDFAEHIGISVQELEAIFSGEKGITAPLSMKSSRSLGASPQFWLNLQNNWALSQVDEADYKNISLVAA
jgi:addiction module HigA family antidote